MKHRLQAHAMWIPVSSVAYPVETPKRFLQDHPSTQNHIPSSSSGSLMLKQSKYLQSITLKKKNTLFTYFKLLKLRWHLKIGDYLAKSR